MINDGINKRGQPITVQQWTLDVPKTVMQGLWHLEGELVSILGDGNVFPQQVVVNGSVTLPSPVTRCIIGIPFTCRAKSLPITTPQGVIEGRRKRVTGLALRLDRSRGLQAGRAQDNLYPIRERSTELLGQPTRMINGQTYIMTQSNWDENGQTYFVQSDPLPATILSYVQEVEVGDDPD